MTESIKVLGHTLNLLPGTSRPHYVTSNGKFPRLYAWAPGLVRYWEVGITLPDRSDCQGKGVTLEEAEKSFVAALEKYNEETQNRLASVTALIAASREYSLPETITVLGQTLTYEERGFYSSDPTAKFAVTAWVPIPNKWMLGILYPNGLKVCGATGTTAQEAEENLIAEIKSYMSWTEDQLKNLAELVSLKTSTTEPTEE